MTILGFSVFRIDWYYRAPYSFPIYVVLPLFTLDDLHGAARAIGVQIRILGFPALLMITLSRLFHHRHLIILQARNVRHGLEHVALHTAGTTLEHAAGSFTTEAWDLRPLLLPGGRDCRVFVQRLVVYVDLSTVIGKPNTKNGMVLRLGWYLGLEDQRLVYRLGELGQGHRLLLWEAVHLLVNIV